MNKTRLKWVSGAAVFLIFATLGAATAAWQAALPVPGEPGAVTRPFVPYRMVRQAPSLNVKVSQFDVETFPSVTVYVQVTNESGQQVPGLTLGSFTLTEKSEAESAPTTEQIVSVEEMAGQAQLSVALVIDASGSMSGSAITGAKTAAKLFVDSMGASDQACLVRFASDATVSQALTTDKSVLKAAIDRLTATGSTSMYDGVYLGIEQLAAVSGVKALIVLADGDDNYSWHTNTHVINYAKSLGVPIYSIGLGSSLNPTRLQELSDNTGGYYKGAPTAADLQQLYLSISSSIRNQYKITYTTHNTVQDERDRTVTVTATTTEASGSGTGVYRSPFVKLWVEIVGRDRIRVGQNSSFRIIVGNSGNVDASAVEVMAAAWSPTGDVQSGQAIAWTDGTRAAQLVPDPALFQSVIIGGLAAGETSMIVFPVPPSIFPLPGCGGKIAVAAEPDITPEEREKRCAADAALLRDLEQKLEQRLDQEQRLLEKKRQLTKEIKDIDDQLGDPILSDEDRELLRQARDALIQQLEELENDIEYVRNQIKLIERKIREVKVRLEGCNGTRQAPTARFTLSSAQIGLPYAGTSAEIEICVVASIDPNDIAGPAGYGDPRYVPLDHTFQYIIYFENLPAATAEAEDIVVTAQIDPDLDWTWFQFGDSSHPSTLTTNFNPSTGKATWTFNSINLPPNVNPPEGEGWVTFTIKPKKDLTTGTEIRNKASITFDYNAPIDTPEWVNTIDNLAPTSTMGTRSVRGAGDHLISWSGTDDANGSGVRDYTIYVSDNGIPYAPWLTNTTDTSAVFTGQYGHTYRFYCRARDNVGNVEQPPLAPQYTLPVGSRPECWKGLAMVSVPLIPDDPDPKQIAAFDASLWACYFPNLGRYVLYSDDPGQLTWFIPAENTPGRGFWARFPGSAITIPSGTIPPQDQPATIHLLRGWNIIGNPFLSQVKWDLNAIQVQVTGAAATSLKNARNVVSNYAWGWRQNPSDPYKGSYCLVYDSAIKPGVNDKLEPWQGYWVKASKECDLIIPAP